MEDWFAGLFLIYLRPAKIMRMFSRVFIIFFILAFLCGVFPIKGWAQLAIPDDSSISTDNALTQGGFAKPYEYERQAYGYDPEGVDYHENQSEDFQVIFFSSAPFAAGASFLLTGLTSLATNGHFQVGGDYFLPFLGLTFAGTTTITCVSVLTNKYPPPGTTAYVNSLAHPQIFTFNVPLVTAKF